MYSFTEEDIEKLSHLARIKITTEGKLKLKQNLEKVIRYIEQLAEVPTENVPLCVHVLEQEGNVLRPDEGSADLSRETFLQNAPDQIGGMIRTPPVMKSE